MEDINKIDKDTFDFLLKNGKRSSVVLGYDFESFTLFSFIFVKRDLPRLISQNNFDDIFFECFRNRNFNIFRSDLKNIPIKEAVSFILWIYDEMKVWGENEINFLSGEPDLKLIAAGISELDKFGYKNVLKALSNGDITKHAIIEKMPYGDIFDQQWQIAIENKISKKLIKNEK